MEENTPSEKTEKRGPGQPKVNIDWKKVDDLLIAGCLGTGIAAYLGIRPETLYDRCLTDHGKHFHQYSQQKREKGDEILRAHQFAKAIGLTDKGDNTLLIWLGKTRLKQRESDAQNSNITLKVTPDGIGSGVKISAEKLPDSPNPIIESGDEKSRMGSS